MDAERFDKVPRKLLRLDWSCTGRVRLRMISPEQVEFRPTAGDRISGLLFALMGFGAILLGWFVGKSGFGDEVAWGGWILKAFCVVFAILGTVAGLIVLVIGLVAVLMPSLPIVFDRRVGVIRRKRGLGAGGEAVRMAEVAAVQICAGPVRRRPNRPRAFQICLLLHGHDSPRFGLVGHRHERSIRADAEALAEFLGVPLLDHTDEDETSRIEAALAMESAGVAPDPADVELLSDVPRELTRRRGPARRNLALHFPSLTIAVFERVPPSAASRVRMLLQFGIALAIAIVALFFLEGIVAWIASGQEFAGAFLGPLRVFVCIVAAVIGLPALARLVGIPRPKEVRIDMHAGTVHAPSPRADRDQGLPVKNIAALQICQERIGSDDSARTLYELNVVLRQPPGDRRRLVAHGDSDAIRSEASQLADLLKVPLLDHLED